MESFRRCRKQYWFSYVSGEEWPPGTESAASLIGNGVHRAMQKLCETNDPRDGADELDLHLRMPIHAIAGPETEPYGMAQQLHPHGVTAHHAIGSDSRSDRPGEQRVRELDRDDAPKTVDCISRFVERIANTEEWSATPGPGCTFCDWRSRCDQAQLVETEGIDWLEDTTWEREAAPF